MSLPSFVHDACDALDSSGTVAFAADRAIPASNGRPALIVIRDPAQSTAAAEYLTARRFVARAVDGRIEIEGHSR